MPGVVESEFSYEQGSGVVTYDPDVTDPETFIAELAGKTGFQGRVVESTEAAGRERTPAGEHDNGGGEHDRSHSNQ